MILEAICTVFFALVKLFIGLLPDLSALSDISQYGNSFISMLAKGLSFFPAKLFFICIGNIAFWVGAQLVWAIIEWVYKKIPGVE